MSQADEDDASVKAVPYLRSFFGNPYKTKSILNTLDRDSIFKFAKEVASAPVTCLTFGGEHALNLSTLLFSQKITFSNVPG